MGSLHNIYVYQITTVYTLTILQFYMSIRYITNSELKKKEREKEGREGRKGREGERTDLRESLALFDHTILRRFWAMSQVRRRRQQVRGSLRDFILES